MLLVLLHRDHRGSWVRGLGVLGVHVLLVLVAGLVSVHLAEILVLLMLLRVRHKCCRIALVCKSVHVELLVHHLVIGVGVEVFGHHLLLVFWVHLVLLHAVQSRLWLP